MGQVRVLNPCDQPPNRARLITEIRNSLNCPAYHTFRIVVAFAKSGPLLRLQPALETWARNNKRVEAIIGLSQRGTSHEALEWALEHFTNTYVVYPGEYITFHPKMYLFHGENACRFYIGSHNLTVGGTETNFESGVILDLALPEDEVTVAEVQSIWANLLPLALPLNSALLSDLKAGGLLLDEAAAQKTRHSAAQQSRQQTGSTTSSRLPFPRISIKPPSALPVKIFSPATRPTTQPLRAVVALPTPVQRECLSDTLVIEISPHNNGEMFLSRSAVAQNPGFFGFPFTGQTTPKKMSNPSYPQRTPDPIVNLRYYDREDNLVLEYLNYALNMVHYELKSEIRVQIPQDLVRHAPKFSILVMQRASDDADYDYDMDIYHTNSISYANYISVCNQTLPSGGGRARRMGWL